MNQEPNSASQLDSDIDAGAAGGALGPDDGENDLACDVARGGHVAMKKSYVLILEQEITQGEHELRRSARGLLFSGLAAGLDVGFSVFITAVIGSAHRASTVLFDMVKASAYSAGFLLVIFGRSELFTEHTTLAVLPVLARRGTLRQLIRLWGLVLAANIAGGALFALLLVWLGPALRVVDRGPLFALGAEMVAHSSPEIFVSAVVAGWMMGLVSWLVTAARDTVGQIIFVWFITGAIGLMKLHHSIVGSIEVLANMFGGGSITLLDFGRFLAFAAVGNAVGGSVFVALLRFAHARAPAPGEGGA